MGDKNTNGYGQTSGSILLLHATIFAVKFNFILNFFSWE
jgi:hypothetical protein